MCTREGNHSPNSKVTVSHMTRLMKNKSCDMLRNCFVLCDLFEHIAVRLYEHVCQASAACAPVKQHAKQMLSRLPCPNNTDLPSRPLQGFTAEKSVSVGLINYHHKQSDVWAFRHNCQDWTTHRTFMLSLVQSQCCLIKSWDTFPLFYSSETSATMCWMWGVEVIPPQACTGSLFSLWLLG